MDDRARTGIRDRTGRMICAGDLICAAGDKHPDACGVWYSDTDYNGEFRHTRVGWDGALAQWDVPRDEEGFLAYPQHWLVLDG
jgi:hypothetical protein